MATTATAKYLPESPKGQPLSFNPRECTDQCTVIRNLSTCVNGAISNPSFLGTITPAWTIVNVTQTGSDPCIISGPLSAAPELHQEIELENGKPYIIYYSFESDAGAWACTMQGDAISAPTSLWTSTSDLIQTGYKRFTSGATASDTLELVFALPANDTPVTCYYAFICEDTDFIGQTDYCIQLPMYEKAQAELLNLTDEVVGLATTFTYGVAFNDTSDNTNAPAGCGTPYTDDSQVVDAFAQGLQLTATGQYFIEIDTGTLAIDWGLNNDNDTSKEVILRFRDGTLTRDDQYAVNAGDSNDDILFLSTDTWVNLDYPSFWTLAKSECDDTNEHVKHDLDFNSYSFTPNFFEKTVTMADNTFYRIKYKLDKCSISSVKFSESDGTVIFEASSDGVQLDKIFKTGSMASTTVTVRFEIGDALEYPDPSWNSAMLTEVQLWELCDWSVRVETDQEVFVSTLTETHDSSPEVDGYSENYHPNIEYCLDVNSLSPGCYQLRAVDGCDASRYWISNCLTVCENMKNLSEISWTPDRVICSGTEVLDYVAYPDTQYFWIQADLQDLTIEEENAFYRRADGFWEKPWAYQNTVEVLQVWPMSPFLRQALAVAMTGTFMINGVEYQKLNDDSYDPQFQARYDSPLRILVNKVGDFIISRE